MPVERIVSGGQTGVDRAALDVAIELGIRHGGWCPKGRLAEDGPIDTRYELRETDSPLYHIRTRQNVIDSDATLILHRGPMTGGTELTRKFALEVGRPLLTIDVSAPPDLQAIGAWLRDHAVGALNIAGPRESTSPGIYEQSRQLLLTLLREAKRS